MPTIISPIGGSFVVGHLPVICSGPFIGFRSFPAIPPVLLWGLFRVGAGAFVGCLAVELGLRNEYSLGYLVPVDDLYAIVDISICLNLL